MRGRPRPRTAWALLTAVATIVTLGAVAAPAASAATAPQYCTLNISTGDYSCTTVDPSSKAAARLARPSAEAAGSILLGRFFDAPDRDSVDGYFSVTANAGCDNSPDLDYSVLVMPSGWNDRVSSFQAYSNCDVRLWKNGGATGTVWGPSTYADSLGPMDNQTSSITFY